MAHPSHTGWSAHIDALLLHTYTLRKEPVAVTCHDGTGPVRLFRARFKWVIAFVNFRTVPVRAFPDRSLDARSKLSGRHARFQQNAAAYTVLYLPLDEKNAGTVPLRSLLQARLRSKCNHM